MYLLKATFELDGDRYCMTLERPILAIRRREKGHWLAHSMAIVQGGRVRLTDVHDGTDEDALVAAITRALPDLQICVGNLPGHRRVLRLLRELGPTSPEDICKITVNNRFRVARQIRALCVMGLVEHIGEGLYQAKEDTRAPGVADLPATAQTVLRHLEEARTEVSLVDLPTTVGLAVSTVGHALRTLRALGLVDSRRAKLERDGRRPSRTTLWHAVAT